MRQVAIAGDPVLALFHILRSLNSCEDWAPVDHDDVMKWKHFYVTGPLCREFTGHRLITRTKASDAEHSCFL